MDQFVGDQIDLLALESKAQERQTRAKLRTYPSEVRTVSQAKGGLGGTVLTVGSLDGKVDGMKAGSWVELSSATRSQKVKGLVVSHESGTVKIHVPWTNAMDGELYRIRGIPLNFEKYFHQNLEGIPGLTHSWKSALLGGQPLDSIVSSHTPPFQDEGLDQSQQSAVSFVLSRPDLALVWGPPGGWD